MLDKKSIFPPENWRLGAVDAVRVQVCTKHLGLGNMESFYEDSFLGCQGRPGHGHTLQCDYN